MTVFQIGHQGVFPILGIVHRFRQTGSLVWTLLIQPIPECLQYRLLLFKTERLGPQYDFLLLSTAHNQTAWSRIDLHCRKAVISTLLPFRYGICEITSHMCPARAAFDIRQIVITLVSVGLQISTNPSGKMLHGTLPLSLCNDRAGSAEAHLLHCGRATSRNLFQDCAPAHSVPELEFHLPSDIYASVTDGENNHKHDRGNSRHSK